MLKRILRWKFTIISLTFFLIISNSIAYIHAQSFNSPVNTATLTSGSGEWFSPSSTIRYRSTILTFPSDTKVITGLVTYDTNGNLQLHSYTNPPSWISGVSYSYSDSAKRITLFNRPSGSANLGIRTAALDGQNLRIWQVVSTFLTQTPTFNSNLRRLDMILSGTTGYILIYAGYQCRPGSIVVDGSTQPFGSTFWSWDAINFLINITSVGLSTSVLWSGGQSAGSCSGIPNQPPGGNNVGGVGDQPIPVVQVQEPLTIKNITLTQPREAPQLGTADLITIFTFIGLLGTLVFAFALRRPKNMRNAHIGGLRNKR